MKSVVVALCLLSTSVFAWGFDGHRYLSSKMQDPLPTNLCIRQWFTSKQTYALQDSSCDPDRWRYTTAGALYDPNEGPRHYLEVDWVQPITDYPRDYNAVIARIGALNASRNGIVPWRVEQLYGQLVTDFQSRDATRILTTTFVLSHYVMDSFSVLHNTKTSDPNGVHSRWESDMLNSTSNLNGIAALANSSYLGTPGRLDPRNAIFDLVIVGNGLNGQLTSADLNTPGDMTAFYNAVKDLTARRWADGLTVMASIIWQAWVDAGKPELTGFSGSCSRASPTVDLVVRGFPPAGGFTKVDGGVVNPPVDAGRPDAGAPDAGPADSGSVSPDSGIDGGSTDGGDAGDAGDGGDMPDGGYGGSGGSGGFTPGFGGFGGGGGGAKMEPGCSCSAVDAGSWWLLLAAVALFTRRRN